jgi:hypothetical protein
MGDKFVECGSHGKSKPAFLCVHLIREENVGWNEPEVYDRTEDDDFYDCIHAWCDDCEDIGRLTTGFVENSFANVQLVCEECALKFKQANLK